MLFRLHNSAVDLANITAEDSAVHINTKETPKKFQIQAIRRTSVRTATGLMYGGNLEDDDVFWESGNRFESFEFLARFLRVLAFVNSVSLKGKKTKMKQKEF